MTRGLRSLSWNWFLAAYVVLIAVLLFAAPAHATSTPPTIDIPSVTVMENAGSAPVVILKTKASSYSKINVQSDDVNGTAKPNVDYKPVNVTLTLANNATSTRLPIGIIDNATYQGPRAFTLKLTILRFGQVPASYTPITVTINDDEAPPPPSPPPSGLAGETPIADNFDAPAGLEPEQGPATPSVDPVGAFRMFASAGQLLRDDPLVLPCQPGASHLHQFFGNTGTNACSTYQSLRTTGGTTAGTDQAHPANRSSYWFPAMLDGIGNVVKPRYLNIYYKRNPASDPLNKSPDQGGVGIQTDLPNGIRFVFGANLKTGTNFIGDPNNSEHWAIRYECQASEDGKVSNGTATGRYWTIADVAAAGCPVGARLMILVDAPNCWDGVNLDSADHRSHMAWATGPYYQGQFFNACPADHPYMIPDMEVQIAFQVDANLKTWCLSSDMMVPGAACGSTFHMDYWEAWSPTIKAAWHKGCIYPKMSCSNGGLGNGLEIKGAGVPVGYWPAPVYVPLASIP